MQNAALEGGFTQAPQQSAIAFRAALNAMARPGRIETLSGATAPMLSTAAATLLLTLCDPDTPIYLAGRFDSADLKDWLRFHTGAPIVGPEHSMFAVGDWASLNPLDRFPIGVPEYPDRSTTLIVECDALRDTGARLTGPGIEVQHHLSLPEVDAFQRNAQLFPLGLDFYFTADAQLAALPRTTKVEAS